MTESEAIVILDCSCYECSYGCESVIDCTNADCVYKKAYLLAIQALEKQIPMKPKCIDKEMETFDCPCCGHTIIALDDMTIHNNCLMCGQKLDWSE